MKGILKRPECEIFYEVIGNGPAIIFAHGLGGNYLSWWQQIPYFKQKRLLVDYLTDTLKFHHITIRYDNAGTIPYESIVRDENNYLIERFKVILSFTFVLLKDVQNFPQMS